MIEIHWRGGRPGADGPFYALLILGLGLLAALLGFIAHHSAALAERAVDTCLAVADSVAAIPSALLIPWAVVSVMVGFAVVAALWQVLATRALLAWAFGTRGLTTLVSYVNKANDRSILMCERLGAVLDTKASTPNGIDCHVFRHMPGVS